MNRWLAEEIADFTNIFTFVHKLFVKYHVKSSNQSITYPDSVSCAAKICAPAVSGTGSGVTAVAAATARASTHISWLTATPSELHPRINV